VGDRANHQGWTSSADRLYARAAGLRAPLRNRVARPRLQRDAVEFHVPIMVAAMKTESTPRPKCQRPCPSRLLAMVEGSEKYRKHCILMENCNYDRPEMMVYNMVRQGCSARSPCRGRLSPRSALDQVRRHRRRIVAARVGHEAERQHLPDAWTGSIANCLDINRGDRFDYLVSMSGPSRGLQAWAAEHVPADSPKRHEKYVLGDINVSLIKTANGRRSSCSTRRTCRGPTAASTKWKARRACSRAIRIAIRRGRGKADTCRRCRTARDVRASAVERDRRPSCGRWSRRHGLHRGLPLDQVPARGKPTDFNVYRRRITERRRGFKRTVGGNAQPGGRLPNFTRGAGRRRPRCRFCICDGGACERRRRALGGGPQTQPINDDPLSQSAKT